MKEKREIELAEKLYLTWAALAGQAKPRAFGELPLATRNMFRQLARKADQELRAGLRKRKRKLPRPKKRKLPRPQRPSAMRDTIAERFRQFHSDNPHVYGHIEKLVLALHKKGRYRFGMKAIWEQLRWRVLLGHVRVRGPYRLNNIFTSRYARMFLEKHPGFRGFFRTRRLLSA